MKDQLERSLWSDRDRGRGLLVKCVERYRGEKVSRGL